MTQIEMLNADKDATMNMYVLYLCIFEIEIPMKPEGGRQRKGSAGSNSQTRRRP